MYFPCKMLPVAYIDPGTGAMVLQMIMAALVGAGIYFRKAIGRIFGRREPPKKPEAEDQKKT